MHLDSELVWRLAPTLSIPAKGAVQDSMVWAKFASVHDLDVLSCSEQAPSRLSAALPWDVAGEPGTHGWSGLQAQMYVEDLHGYSCCSCCVQW